MTQHKKKTTIRPAKPMTFNVESGTWVLTRYKRVFVPLLSVAIIAMAVAVPVAVFRSMASTGAAAFEAEKGALTGVTTGVDTNASGGSYVQFGAGAGSNYDLIVTAASASPSAPTAGQNVTFSATIKNQGSGAVPAGIIIGNAWYVDGTKVNWSDTTTTGLAPGATANLTANSGPAAISYWPSTAGTHTIQSYVDDINRFPNETNENNNTLNFTLNVTGTTPPPGNCSGQGDPKVGNTRGGLLGFANGFAYAQLSASDKTRYMDVVADTGAKWYRMNMEDWNMSEFQDVVSKANARGLCVVGNISANKSGDHWGNPTDHLQWAKDAAAEVTALKGSVHVWEIWNEQNNAPGFWSQGSSVQQTDNYADLLHQTYLQIKAADPTAIVLGGGLSPCTDGKAGQICWSVNYWKEVYKWNKSQNRQGSEQLFDGLAHHPYYYPNNPIGDTGTGDGYYQTYLIHQLMCDPSYGGPTGDCTKRIWGTEAGYPTDCPDGNPEKASCVSESTAAARYPAMFDQWMNTTNGGWGSFTGPYFKHELQNNNRNSHEGFMGIIDSSWNKKEPTYDVWQTYAKRTD